MELCPLCKKGVILQIKQKGWFSSTEYQTCTNDECDAKVQTGIFKVSTTGIEPF